MKDFVAWVAKTGMKPVFDLLAVTVLSSPDVTSDARVSSFWTTMMITTNALFVVLIVAAGLVVSAHGTLQTRYGLKEILPRVAVAALMSNTSLLVCRKAIEATTAVTRAVAGQGVDGQKAAAFFVKTLSQPSGFTEEILVIAALVMAIVVVIMLILRTAVLVVLVGIAPLALAMHALPQTESLAFTWWRAFGACLGLQVVQAAVLVAMVRIFLTSDGYTILDIPASHQAMLGLLVELAMLWLLIKLPGWSKRFILGHQGGRGLVRQVISVILMIKSLGAAAGLARAAGAPRGLRMPHKPSAAVSAPVNSATPRTASRRRLAPRRAAGTTSQHRTQPTTPRGSSGRVPFSHAPTHHAPMAPAPAGSGARPRFRTPHTQKPAPPIPNSARVGSTQPPTFSSRPRPATPVPHTTAVGSAQPPRFQAPGASPATAGRPCGPVTGSGRGTRAGAPRTTAAPAPSATPAAAPPPTFSDAPPPQSAPRRPPTSFRPMFTAPDLTNPPPPDPAERQPRRTRRRRH